MIEKTGRDEFRLSCDKCGDIEVFDSFQDAVDYKKDAANGWRAVKDKNGEWWDLCPACNTPEIISKIKGIAAPDEPRDETGATDSALRALEDL